MYASRCWPPKDIRKWGKTTNWLLHSDYYTIWNIILWILNQHLATFPLLTKKMHFFHWHHITDKSRQNVLHTWNSCSSFFSIQSVTWTKVTSLSPSLGRAFSSRWGGLRNPYLTAKKQLMFNLAGHYFNVHISASCDGTHCMTSSPLVQVNTVNARDKIKCSYFN